MLIFYTNPMSRGQIVRWMLEEAGAAYDERIIAYGDEMKGSRYRAINPMGKVPAIEHNSAVVTEASAICAYLADAFPGAGLAPDPSERAAYYRWFFFAAGPLEQAITTRAAGWLPTEDQERMMGFGSFEQALDVLGSHLEGSAFATGDRFTAADVYLGGQVNFGLQFGTLPKSEPLVAYQKRVTDREPYRTAKAKDAALIAAAKASG